MPKTTIVHVMKTSGMPLVADLAHRHLEKSPPQMDLDGVQELRQLVPVDLLRVGNAVPEHLLSDIKSVSLIYKKKKGVV